MRRSELAIAFNLPTPSMHARFLRQWQRANTPGTREYKNVIRGLRILNLNPQEEPTLTVRGQPKKFTSKDAALRAFVAVVAQDGGTFRARSAYAWLRTHTSRFCGVSYRTVSGMLAHRAKRLGIERVHRYDDGSCLWGVKRA